MNLRRWITALAVLALFAAIGTAQVTSNQVTCTVSAAGAPTIRAEGIAERVGDVVVSCVNGLQLNTGNSADRITLTVNYGVTLTNQNDSTNSKGSDIMLTIDEPNSLSGAAAGELGITGYGPNANIVGVCTAANQSPLITGSNNQQNLAACPAYSFLAGNPLVYYATASTGTGGANAINVYQGVINSNGTSVTFTNVPFVPPFLNTAQQGTQVARVYRVTGVRVNPGSQSSISATVAQPVTNANDVSTFATIASPSVPVATVKPSLTTAVVPSPLSICIQTGLEPPANQPVLPASASYLQFSQAFGGAFKTRVVAITPGDLATATGADLQAATQPVTGSYGSYTNATSESGLLIPVAGATFNDVTGGDAVAGLASSGTRLKAIFSNLVTGTGITYYVSLNNVTDYNDPVAANKTPGTAGDTTSAPFAVLQTQNASAATAEASLYAVSGGAVNAGTKYAIPVVVPVVALTVSSSGTAEAVWEITNTAGVTDNATYTFAVYAVFPANGLSATPTTPAAVTLGYAPTNGTASTSPVGVTTTWIPRYVAPGAAQTLLALLPCRTTLLFPYVTSALVGPTASWQTGVAIENTGSDPLTTVGQTGTCSLSFYGTGAPPAIQTPTVAPGSSYAFLVSDPANTGTAVTNWSGYIFAICNFNYGHGFVFIEDNTRMMAMGYLATVLDQQTSSVPRGQFTLGEGLKN